MQLQCIKTTETMNYGSASKHNKALGKKKLTKDFGKTKIQNMQPLKSRSEIASIKADIRNKNESPSDHSD